GDGVRRGHRGVVEHRTTDGAPGEVVLQPADVEILDVGCGVEDLVVEVDGADSDGNGGGGGHEARWPLPGWSVRTARRRSSAWSRRRSPPLESSGRLMVSGG